MPDYFVPLDTTRYTRFYREATVKGILLQTHLGLFESHRDKWKKQYPSFETFDRRFHVDDETLALLRRNAEAEGVTCPDEEFEQSAASLRLQLKALVARDLWEMQEYYRIMNEDSPVILKAIELLPSAQFSAPDKKQ